MPDENEGLATGEADNAQTENVEQAEQQDSEPEQQEGEQEQPAEAPKAETPTTDYKKQYEELQKLQSRQANELGNHRREMEQLKQELARFKPKEQAQNPLADDPWYRNLDEKTRGTVDKMTELVAKKFGLDKLPNIEQRIQNQEHVFRQRELADEVNRLKASVGEETFNKHSEAIGAKYDQIAQSMGINYWPTIPLEDVYNMVTAKELKSSLAERAKNNLTQRANRVAAADTGRTSPKTKNPSGLDDDALAKMSPRERFRAILAEEKRRPE